ncbi:MAG: hypothetical protein GY707_16700, partial [Desulfobacteraceae bacterium]|nr:hypothetical protein [Desulfobacteraceae bacterium]
MEKSLKDAIKIAGSIFFIFALLFSGQAFAAKSIKRANKALPKSSIIKSNSAVKITGHPDLMVQMVTVNPQIPTVSKDMITIKVTVKNRGNGPTSAICHLTMFLRSVNSAGTAIPGDQRYLIPGYTNNIPILGPGARHEISKVFTTQFIGRKKVSGVINTESLQPGEESNN